MRPAPMTLGNCSSQFMKSLAPFTLVVGLSLSLVPTVFAQVCPEEPLFANFNGPGQVACPCFIAGEEAGAIFDVPAAHYPIEVLRVGIGWGSQFGGAPTSLEQAIKIYPAGLPNPGVPIFSVGGPQLVDGFLNEFDLTAYPGSTFVNGGPFTVTLEFLNDNAGNIFAPTVVHDGNGCQLGKNAVKAIPGGWNDACLLGVTGDWIFYIIYRQTNCASTSVDDEIFAASLPAMLFAPYPNPFTSQSRFNFMLGQSEHVRMGVYDLRGRLVRTLADEIFPAGTHDVTWSGTTATGAAVGSGVYFVNMEAGTYRSTQKVVLNR